MSEHDPIDWDELDAETQHEVVSLAEKLAEESEQSGGRTASRREFLGAITAAGLGGSLLSQGADRAFEDFVSPASAGTQSVAQFGEAGEPFDFVAEDIYGPGGQGSGDAVNFESVSSGELNNAIVKDTSDDLATKLNEAATSGKPLWVGPGTHAVSSKTLFDSGEDVYITGSPNATLKNAGFDGEFIEILGSSEVVIENIRFDFNQSNRTDTTASELDIRQADRVIVRDVTILENIAWAVGFNGCSNVIVRDVSIETSYTGPGADGIHFSTGDGAIDNALVSGLEADGSDDVIGAVAKQNSIRNLSVSGGTVSASNGGGLKVEIDPDADASTEIKNVSVDSYTIEDAGTGEAVEVTNERDDARDIKNVDIDVTIGSADSDAAHVADVAGGEVDIDVVAPGDKALLAENADDVDFSVQCQNVVGNGASMYDCVGGSITLGVESDGTDNGVYIEGCENVTVQGECDNFATGVNGNGPSISRKCVGIGVIGLEVTNCATGVSSGNEAGEWRVVACDLRDTTTALSLSTTQGANVIGNNNT